VALYVWDDLMLSEPYNTFLVIFICILAALHFSGKLGSANKSPTLKYMNDKYPKVPRYLIGLAIFIAVAKSLTLVINGI
jgi:hypothetical protein